MALCLSILRLFQKTLSWVRAIQDNPRLALFGFFQDIVKDPMCAQSKAVSEHAEHCTSFMKPMQDISQINSVMGIWAVSPRQVDLSFPGAFNKAIVACQHLQAKMTDSWHLKECLPTGSWPPRSEVGNRPDFRAFDPVSWIQHGATGNSKLAFADRTLFMR